MRLSWRRASLCLLVLGAVACTAATTSSGAVPPEPIDVATTTIPQGASAREHLIFIVQENRRFDHYFGTYPGADGIPTDAEGRFEVLGGSDPASVRAAQGPRGAARRDEHAHGEPQPPLVLEPWPWRRPPPKRLF